MLLKLASSALFVLSLVNLSLADAKIDHEVNVADNQNVTDSAFGIARTEVIIFQNGTYLKTDVKGGESGKAVLAGIDKEALQTIAGLKIYVINYGAVTFWQAVLRCIDQGLKLASVDNFINTNTLSILLHFHGASAWTTERNSPPSGRPPRIAQGLSRIITVQAWIGATDLGQPGSFVWLESARPLLSSWNDFNVPWSSGQPATTGEACVYASLELNWQAKWRSVPCDSPGNGSLRN